MTTPQPAPPPNPTQEKLWEITFHLSRAIEAEVADKLDPTGDLGHIMDLRDRAGGSDLFARISSAFLDLIKHRENPQSRREVCLALAALAWALAQE